MLLSIPYNRTRALAYARRWAFDRNPLFYDFAGLGGDCTNFTSQCLYAGCCTMNFTPTFGWYYRSINDRAPAWTGVQFLYNFLTQNQAEGPYAVPTEANQVEPGDVIQLQNARGIFYHSLLVSDIREGEILVAAHCTDAFNRPLSSYQPAGIRYLHILGARSPVCCGEKCFPQLISGSSLDLTP